MDFVHVIGHGPCVNLDDACRLINEIAGESNYFWHYESLKVVVKDSKLMSHQIIGDSLADEWAVLRIILKASLLLPEFYFTVEDQDGQFILFEAADELEDDLEDSELAVYIWNGKIFVLPGNAKVSLPIPKKLEVKFQSIEMAMDRAMKQTFHHACLVLPKKSMAFLQSHPQYVGPAIHSFCYRTPEETHRAATLDLEGNGQVINGILRFLRLQYAQLVFQPIKVPENLLLDNLGHRMYLGLRILLSADPSLCSLYSNFDESTFKPAYQLEDPTDWLNEVDSDQDSSGSHLNPETLLPKGNDYEAASSEFDDSFVTCSSGQSGSESSYDSEQEVLEALKGDPELFMKTLQLHSEAGVSIEELITRVKDVNLHSPVGKQKGLADINSEHNGEMASEDEKDIDLLYNETIDTIKKRLAEDGSVEVFSDCDPDGDCDLTIDASRPIGPMEAETVN